MHRHRATFFRGVGQAVPPWGHDCPFLSRAPLPGPRAERRHCLSPPASLLNPNAVAALFPLDGEASPPAPCEL
ncbi:hypothetical protein E2562_017926 [Oryza meyeriana var. granulata]|uniref:Uncharacterized protein n=1 Tax=Oryza meyeriana var. granulata TaxID=110450 RepID=A0A6G1CPX9_9ORYZ|nr:hypothetical protein E2562_017926 [Oryza meyeriana var. granulata]